MVSSITEVRTTWNRLLSSYGFAPEAAAARWQEIETRYCEPHRHYHNLDHIRSMIETMHGLLKDGPSAACLFAAIYHDVIYETTRSDNEEKSAQLAQEALSEFGLPEQLTDAVQTLILCTKKHLPAKDSPLAEESALFLDADLFILAAPEADYDRYRRQIRTEYHWVDDNNFRRNRALILRRFLERDHIFFSEAAAAFESQARSNLAREISELETKSN